MRDLYEEFEHDSDLLNLESEVAMCRALFVDWVERYDEHCEALLAWHASWAKDLSVSEDQIMALEAVVSERETALAKEPAESPDELRTQLTAARKFLVVLKAGRDRAPRPRQVLSIADGHRLIDATSRIVERIERIRGQNAISRFDFFRLTQEMGREVRKNVSDPEALRRIREGWLSIAI